MYERLQALIDEHHEDLSRYQRPHRARLGDVVEAGRRRPRHPRQVQEGVGARSRARAVRLRHPAQSTFWQNTRVTDVQRNALLDHELMHAAVAYDENGEDQGRRARPHLLPDPQARPRRVRRHRHALRLWKSDIVAFVRALEGADKQVQAAQWVSYSATRDALSKVGYYVPKEAIATWSEDERREVMTFALLRYEGEQDAADRRRDRAAGHPDRDAAGRRDPDADRSESLTACPQQAGTMDAAGRVNMVCLTCGRRTQRVYNDERHGFGPCRCGGELRRAGTHRGRAPRREGEARAAGRADPMILTVTASTS
jgi:hypothetical protein